MMQCAVCKRSKVRLLLDCGRQPVCSHFLGDIGQLRRQYTHRLAIGQCNWCGTMQLFDRFPVHRLVPKYSWMVRYSEPEDHLDELTTKLIALPGITQKSNICGLSVKDHTLLDRFSKRGYTKILRLSGRDLRIKKKVYGAETIQQHVTVANAKQIVRQWGKQDIFVTRHILEHAYNPEVFIQAVRELLSPTGYLVIEVPGVDQALKQFDYSTIWEEHTLYFTRATFRLLWSFFGFSLVHFISISYPLEDSLIAVARVGNSPGQHVSMSTLRSSIKQGNMFARGFQVQKRMIRSLCNDQGTIALFGAGHLGCVWLNIFGLSNYVQVIVDNDPNKTGLHMPGSRISIRTTDAVKEPIDLCLLCANPRNEDVMIEKNQLFFRQVRKVASIFPSSKRAIATLRGLRSVKKIPGGFNCTLYKMVDHRGDEYIAKKYRDPNGDASSRLLVEYQSLSFLWKHGIRMIPEPIVMSPEHSLGVYRFVDGVKLPKGKYTKRDALQVIEFWRQVHALRDIPHADRLPAAKDACFCVAEYYESIKRRLGRLTELPHVSQYRRLHTFLEYEFVPVYTQIKRIIASKRINIREMLPKEYRTLSPSDFGFHNALRIAGGSLIFIDFEYFGWDDPAKLVADFFLHPKMNFSYQLRKGFFHSVGEVMKEDKTFPERLAAVYMLQSLRWVLIMLNVFLRQRGDGHQAMKQYKKAKEFLNMTRISLETRPFPLSLL